MSPVPFCKASGAGNDFIILDNRASLLPQKASIIAKLCDRHQGIGADGVLLLDHVDQHQFYASIYNADGSYAEMCGNGVRCFALFLQSIGFDKSPYLIVVNHTEHLVSIDRAFISVKMPPPKNIQWNIPVELEGHTLNIHFVDTGVPHVVVFLQEPIDDEKACRWGKKLLHHDLFAPQKTNVNFLYSIQDQLHIQTYERGVNGLTLACGTGCAAASIFAVCQLKKRAPISLIVRSKDIITTLWEESEGHELIQQGPATITFTGVFERKKYISN